MDVMAIKIDFCSVCKAFEVVMVILRSSIVTITGKVLSAGDSSTLSAFHPGLIPIPHLLQRYYGGFGYKHIPAPLPLMYMMTVTR